MRRAFLTIEGENIHDIAEAIFNEEKDNPLHDTLQHTIVDGVVLLREEINSESIKINLFLYNHVIAINI